MISLRPIWTIDIISNSVLVLISVYLLVETRRIRAMRPHVLLWVYLYWQAVALTVFVLSHSVAHIVQRVMVLMGYSHTWEYIAPVTGGINTLTFVVVAILTFLYRDLESASERYGTLSETKKELEQSMIMLQESSEKIERDAEEIFQKNRELSALYRIATEIGKSLELNKVMSATIREVKDLVKADFLAVYLVKGDKIVLQVSEGLTGSLLDKAAVRSADEPWVKREILQGRAFFVQESLSEKTGKIDEDLKKGGLQAWTAVPIMAKGKVVGVLSVGSTSLDGIDQRQINTLTTIGRYVGIVIENSMLYEELKQKVDDLERFSRFSVGREMRILEMKEQLRSLMANRQNVSLKPEENESQELP
ncbi:MAG: GAF domain-containing protein [Nitrospirota bacterium]